MDRLKTVGILTLVVLLLPLILAWVGVYLAWQFAWGLVLRGWFWSAHARHGRRALFVYSESPSWQAYIEENILPRIRHRAVVLNWSERCLWPSEAPWEARFFERFAGPREFNPLALVFGPRGRVEPVRFYRAFRDLKHGKEAGLREAEQRLLTLLRAAA